MYISTFFSDFMPFSFKIRVLKKKRVTDGQMDGWMNRRTDRPSYKGAWMHLKREREGESGLIRSLAHQVTYLRLLSISCLSWAGAVTEKVNWDGQTNGWTDHGWTNGWTNGRINRPMD